MHYFKCITCGFLFSFLGTSCLQVSGQLNLNNLKSDWKNESLADTTRLDALSKMLEHAHIRSYTDSLAYYADVLIKESIAAGSEKYQALGLLHKGFYYVSNNQTPEAVSLIDSSLAMNQRLGETFGESIAMSLKGLIMMFSGKMDEGLSLVEEAYQMIEKENHLRGMVICGSFMTTAYTLNGNLKERLRFVRQGVTLAEELGDWTSLAEAYHRMADVYLALEILNEGNYYHERALEFCLKSGYKTEELNILGHMASIEDKQGNYQKAIAYLEQIVEWQREHGQRMTLISAEAKLIYVLTNAKFYDRAEKKISTYRSNFDEEGVMSLYAMALVNYSEGKMMADQGDHKKAVELCLAAYHSFKSYHKFEQELETCECLYESYKALGAHEKALEYHEKHQLIQEEINKEQVARDLQKIEFHKLMLADSLQQVEKVRLVQVAHQEEVRKKNRTRNALLGGGFILLLLAGGFYSRWKYVRKSRDIISKEKDRSENLLLNILPAEIAEELKEKGRADARDFDTVSILFTDFKAFTETSEKLSAADLVHEINACFKAFDEICEKRGIEKIKTIGDAYMAAGGLPVPTDDSVKNTILAALDMQKFISARKKEKDNQGEPAFEMRVGVHTGPVVAGIVGVKKFQYDIWGDTVNTASRIESKGEVGRVNISQATYQYIKDDPNFEFESRGKISAKGKGEMEMWFVNKN